MVGGLDRVGTCLYRKGLGFHIEQGGRGSYRARRKGFHIEQGGRGSDRAKLFVNSAGWKGSDICRMNCEYMHCTVGNQGRWV